jgi:hypothetical protein
MLQGSMMRGHTRRTRVNGMSQARPERSLVSACAPPAEHHQCTCTEHQQCTRTEHQQCTCTEHHQWRQRARKRGPSAPARLPCSVQVKGHPRVYCTFTCADTPTRQPHQTVLTVAVTQGDAGGGGPGVGWPRCPAPLASDRCPVPLASGACEQTPPDQPNRHQTQPSSNRYGAIHLTSPSYL